MMKCVALFTTLCLLFTCSRPELNPEDLEMPCPENWKTYEENEKDFQFQRIEGFAKAACKTENEMVYESFFFLNWKNCTGVCCQFGCDPEYSIKDFQFLVSKRDTSYFLETVASFSQSCNYIKLSTCGRLGKKEWEAIKSYFEKYRIGCKREQQKVDGGDVWRFDGVDILVKIKDKTYYESFASVSDSTGRKFLSSIIDDCSLWPSQELRISKMRFEDDKQINLGLWLNPVIFSETLTPTEIRSPYAYREGYSNPIYISYILDLNEIADSTLNTRFFEGELVIPPPGNEEKIIKAHFQIDLNNGFPLPQ
ncbi:MAG: hypothetical protein KDD01_18520 [Phaeodactylibacter sp.]|nr:hypothetical protein [Phaeodactylibacter sp.]